MEISVKEEKNWIVVSVVGRLDTVTAANFEKECLACLDQGKTSLALDLSALEYVSSAGLRSILIVGKKAKASGGGLAICGLTGLVQEVFNMSGFDSFFPVHANVSSLLEGDSQHG